MKQKDYDIDTVPVIIGPNAPYTHMFGPLPVYPIMDDGRLKLKRKCLSTR